MLRAEPGEAMLATTIATHAPGLCIQQQLILMVQVPVDAQASATLNDLYMGHDVDEGRMKRLLCLFKLEFDNPADMLPEVAGRPVYLAMAMDEHQRLKLKPQNLLLNLPLVRRS